MNKNIMPDSLGVFCQDRQVYLFYHLDQDSPYFFRINLSTEGFYFDSLHPQAQIINQDGSLEDITQCRDFRVSRYQKKYFLSFRQIGKKQASSWAAFSNDLVTWKKSNQMPDQGQAGLLVSDYQFKNQYVYYFGKRSVKIALSKDLIKWQFYQKPIFKLPDKLSNDFFLKIGGMVQTDHKIILLYFQHKGDENPHQHSLKAIVLNRRQPYKLLTPDPYSVWTQSKEWAHQTIFPVGTAYINNELISYWQSKDDKLFAISHPYFDTIVNQPQPKRIFFHPVVKRIKDNPILKPIVKHAWESQAVFNSAAVSLGGKVHLVYRAVGADSVSALGYASSTDGYNIDKRLKEPIYTPREPFEFNFQGSSATLFPYASGPGCGGCEDPRITKIDGRIYLTYNAWNGYEPPKVALTSISEDDFANHRWNWKQSVLISHPDPAKVKNPDRINKNWVIFPRKINGKYAILHSLSPIQIDYFDNLDFDGKTFIDSHRAWEPRENRWDIFIRGIGPPPIKTKDGWLVIYHATTSDCGYTLGAMMLDIANPAKILYRSKGPILEPSSWYEKEGLKPNIVYSCGAAVAKNRLFVYYGGADTVVCVATAPLSKFTEDIKLTGSSRLEPISGKID